jgi:hypothetical protein
MKKQIFKSGLILTILILAISCKKDEQPVNELLHGTWHWFKTISPYTGQETTPQTEGYSRVFVFMPNNKMLEYRNNVKIDSSDYSLDINSSNSNTYRITNSTIINSHFYFEADTLIFSEAYVDGPVIYFAKGLPPMAIPF